MFDYGRLKKRAEELGVTQADVAKKLNVDAATVSRHFNGRRMLTVSEAERYFIALNVKKRDIQYYFFN